MALLNEFELPANRPARPLRLASTNNRMYLYREFLKPVRTAKKLLPTEE
jgi:hypothetical protein